MTDEAATASTSEVGTLFSFYGISLRTSTDKTLWDKYYEFKLAAKLKHFFTLIDCDYNHSASERQFILDLIPLTNDSNIIGHIPRRRYVYLDYGVYDTFRDIDDARKAAADLENQGICLIGQLVQMRESDVRNLGVSDQALTAIKAQLARVNFGFGMRAPGWSSSCRTYDASRY